MGAATQDSGGASLPTAGTAVLSDASTPGALYLQRDLVEAHVRAEEPLRLQIKLSGDEWSFDVGEDTDASRDLIDGLVSLQTSPRGWNAIVRAAMGYADLKRVDASILEVRVHAKTANR